MADQLTQQVADAIVASMEEQCGSGHVGLIGAHVSWQKVAEAVIAALNLPVLWGVAIRSDDGTYDANAQAFYSKADAVRRLQSLSEMYPDDRRCLVQRFGPSPWVGVLGGERHYKRVSGFAGSPRP